jgi:type II secretory pathway pseudopilin PulG
MSRQLAPRAHGPARGISLLELAVVMGVVSVLLAVALPRYQDAQRYARIAMLNRLALTIYSASNVYHLQCLAQQTRPEGSDCRQLQVGLVTVRGELEFPQAGLDGIGAPALKVAVKAADKGTCELVYRAPTAMGLRPEVVTLSSTCSR